MQIVQSITLDLLKPFEPESLIPESASFPFRQIHLLDDIPILPDESAPCMGTWKQMQILDPSSQEMVCIIRMGSRDEILPLAEQHDSNPIVVPDFYSLASVASRLYMGSDEIRGWNSNLEMAALAKKNHQTTASTGTRSLGKNPIIMVNLSYNLITGSMPSLPSHERTNTILKNGCCSKDMMDGLACMGYQANRVRYTIPAALYSPNYTDCPLTVFPIYVDNGIFLGFITIYFIEDEPTEAQFQPFSYPARRVHKCYLENSGENASTPTPLEVFMADLIDHTREGETFLKDRARSLRLPLGASYRLCVIQWGKFVLPQADYTMNKLRSCLRFPSFRVLLYHQSVLLLLKGNISSPRLTEEIGESFDESGGLLKICQGHAGFSTANFPLLKMSIAHRQVVTAVRYGMILNPETGTYFYSHYYIYETLDDYKKRYALEGTSVQGLTLLSNPVEDRCDNLTLLRNYLPTERSISSTAKVMHVHRSSVVYRLNKIQGIPGLDLNDPDVRLRLLIFSKVLELQSGHIRPAPAIGTPSSGVTGLYE